MNADISNQPDNQGAGGILTIDLAALAENYRLLCETASPSQVAAVVKADAYGLDAGRVAPVFYAAGCRNFFVAHLGEALKLKPQLADDGKIYVLNGLQPETEALCAQAGIVPVLNSLEQIANWASCARRLSQALPAVLQFDTCMSRLGLSPSEQEKLVSDPALLDGIDLKLVMSHLACGDEPLNAANRKQLACMRQVIARFPGVPVSFANSGGIFLGPDFRFDLARPGIALYGGAPSDGVPNPMKPVVRLDARVIQVRSVPAGTLVGYGGAFEAKRETRVATIAVGYADGWPRHLSNRGAAYFGTTRLPIIGRVSMDSITLDATDLPEGTLSLGSLVELIGPSQTLEDVATICDTIAYELLTSLGHRYRRNYVG